MNRTYGTKYAEAKDLRPKEIAKLIRADIKAAIASGELPAIKVSVTSDHNSIDIRLVGGITASQLYTQAGMASIANNEHEAPYLTTTDYAKAIFVKLEEIHGAYNHDGSDYYTDYFDVHYYGSVSLGWELSKALRDEAKEIHNRRAAKPAIRFYFEGVTA